MGRIENGVYVYQGLPDDLDSLESYQAIKDITCPPLDDEQSIDLLRALFAKQFSLFYSTGLGKTFVASAYMKAIKNLDPSAKSLMVIKKNQEIQTPQKVTSISGLRCKFLSASLEDLPEVSMLDSIDVLMISHDFLNSPKHMERLLYMITSFKALVVDEVHLLSNISEASSAFMLYCLSNRIEYTLGLTATPVTVDVNQFTKVLKVVSPTYIDNYRKLGSELKRFGMGALPPEINDLFKIRERSLANLESNFIYVTPMSHQIGARGVDLFNITKGPGSVNQINVLAEYIKDHRPLKGLVYAWRSSIYSYVIPCLTSMNIRCAGINGKTPKKERLQILEDFENNKYDCLITDIKEALDMDSSYVVFYEFTPHVKQMVGRADRGLNPKPLEVTFMITLKTDEYGYFLRNVYDISQEVEEILGIDFKEVTKASLKYRR